MRLFLKACAITARATETPRALAATPDGSKVYAAAFHSGNRTTALHEVLVPDGGEAAGGMVGPATNVDGAPRPETGIILKFNGTHWVDEINRVWDDKVRLSLPDKDVFVINANANPPAQISGACDGIANIGYIRASGFESPFGQFYAKAGERGWWREELACGHDAMLDMPDELTALLLRRT